jgi:DNA uptake protein ComE-like DNA-binding protein
MMRSSKARFSIFCLGAAALSLLYVGTAKAASLWDPYIPPEVAFSDDLRQHVTVPDKVNINHGSMSELKVLPGFDEEIVLKVLRARPFEDIQDFYKKMPGLDKKSMDRLIRQVQPKLLFN